jgi:hypothetical protein
MMVKLSHVVLLTICSICGIFGGVKIAHAYTEIPFSSTFNCPEATQPFGTPITGCQGWQGYNNEITSNGSRARISVLDNNPNGGGGRGFGQAVGDGSNNNSGGIVLTFPAQSEMWVRWYMKYPLGFSWVDGNPHHSKILRFRGNQGDYTDLILNFRTYPGANLSFDDYGSNWYGLGGECGWRCIMGGALGDGVWHSYEVHIKAGNPGIVEAWVDGNRVFSHTNYPVTAPAGFNIMTIQDNQGYADNGEDVYISFDDFAISNTGYIGPISGGDTTPPVISNPLPSGEQVYGTTSVNMTVTTNETATCKYGTSDVSYASLPNTFTTTGSTSHSQTVATTNGASYIYYVRCQDDSENANTTSTTVSFSIAAASSPANLLFSERFENNSWSARGWYDSSTQGSIVSGGQSGNALQWAWTSGQTNPTNGSAIRNTFSATDEMFVSVYMKFSSTWRGSQQTYHPHLIYFLSTLDSAYSALANNYLNNYIEAVSDIGTPYAIRPQINLQDNLRVSTAYGTPPINITATTENRSVNYCNGYLSGQDSGSSRNCYSIGGGAYYSSTSWKGSTEIPKDQWVKIETYFKMNRILNGVAQPDGIMRQWVDGVLWLNKNNIVYRTNQDATKKWDKIALAPYIGDGSPINQTMWIDELSVYDGPPAQSTALAAPVNLRILGE